MINSKNFKTLVVVNPNSANQKTLKEWQDISLEIKKNIPDFDYVFTHFPHHATILTRQALKDGYEMIVAVGGDGTNNEVINGFFEDEKLINPEAIFATISRGTGCDLIKTLGIPKDYRLSSQALSGAATKKIDLGKMEFIDYEGRRLFRYFINIADFGMGGETVNRVNHTTKAFGGFASFLWGTLVTSFTFRNKKVRIKIDDKFEKELTIKNVVIANGCYFGGGMCIAPRALMDDGQFEIVIIGDVRNLQGIPFMRKIYRGELIEHPKVFYLQGQYVEAESEEKVLLDIDGEQPGTLPAKFQIIPKIINVKI